MLWRTIKIGAIITVAPAWFLGIKHEKDNTAVQVQETHDESYRIGYDTGKTEGYNPLFTFSERIPAHHSIECQRIRRIIQTAKKGGRAHDIRP